MLSPAEFVESYCGIGIKKSSAPIFKLFILGILAGFLIGMGAVVTNTASHAIDNISVARIINGFLFSFGLGIVIVTGAELFTGNCLITIPLMMRRVSLSGMVRNLIVVYIGNFVGAVLLAVACAYCGQMDLSGGGLAVATMRTAAAKCAIGPGRVVVLGILCNILVCAAVMLSLSSKSVPGRLLGAYVPVAFFVFSGFEHCVANMYYVPAGIFASGIESYAELARAAGVNVDALTWANFFTGNLIPSTIGNIIGGCGFAALIRAGHGPSA